MNKLLTALAVIAAATSFGALAQEREDDKPVVRGETIVISEPAGYFAARDAALVNDARYALDRDAATNSAIVTLAANQGELTVIGTTTDVAQSSRVVMKLKALPGAKKVFAFIEPMTGDSD